LFLPTEVVAWVLVLLVLLLLPIGESRVVSVTRSLFATHTVTLPSSPTPRLPSSLMYRLAIAVDGLVSFKLDRNTCTRIPRCRNRRIIGLLLAITLLPPLLLLLLLLSCPSSSVTYSPIVA
jgi:hypothetical protein